jgi:nicotinamide-nucleotide amidase
LFAILFFGDRVSVKHRESGSFMQAEIISIGGELLIGHTVNTNFAFLAATLAEHGFGVEREVCIPDVPKIMEEAISDALSRAELVITIGGLGPTRDDLTRAAVANMIGLPLQFSSEVFERISAYLAKRLVKLPDEALKVQSMVPQAATPLINSNGTAPGLWCPAAHGRVVVMLPGPPRELKPIFTEQVMPRILERWSPAWYRRTLRVCGVPESLAAKRTETVLAEHEKIDIAYCARPGIVDVRLTAMIDCQTQVDQCMEALRGEFGNAVLVQEDDLVDALARILTGRRMTLAVAESCTGGGIGATITDRAGASEFFVGGIIAYANSIKQRELGVPEQVLKTQGAVSEETARAMVKGVCQRFMTDAGIAVTGIAGPDGGSEEKPVGLVFIATCVQDDIVVKRRIYPGSRETMRERTVNSALNQLREQLTISMKQT